MRKWWLLLLIFGTAHAATADLTWTPPTQNDDGTPLTDLASYDLSYGCTAPGVYDTVQNISAPASSYTVTGLPDNGTCWFAIQAVNSADVRSVYSNEAIRTFSAAELPDSVTSIDVTWQSSQGPPPMTTFFTDFSEYSTGAIDDTSDWSFYTHPTFPWVADIATESGATGGQVLIVDDPSAYGSLASVLENDTIGNQTGDVEIVARMKWENIVNSNGYATGSIAAYVDSATNDAYVLQYVSNGQWRLWFVNNYQEWQPIDITSTSYFTPTADTYFWIRINITGTTISANVGSTESAVDPATWELSGTETSLGSGQMGGLFYNAGAGAVTLDLIGIGTGGDEAPTTGAGGGTSQIRFLPLLGVG